MPFYRPASPPAYRPAYQAESRGETFLGDFVQGAKTAAATPFDPTTLSGLFAYYDSSNELSNTALAVDSWGDLQSALTFTATTTQRPLEVVADALFNNRPSILWDGSNDRMQAGAAADFKVLSDGTASWEFVMCVRPTATAATQYFADEINNSLSNTGIDIAVVAGGAYRVRIANGTGTAYQSASGGTVAAATKQVLGARFSAGTMITTINGADTTTATASGSANNANPTAAMMLGARTSGANFLLGYIVHFAIVTGRTLTAGERSSYQTWLASRFGF